MIIFIIEYIIKKKIMYLINIFYYNIYDNKKYFKKKNK